MSSGGASNFSYAYFHRLLAAIKSNFKPSLLSCAPEIISKGEQNIIFLRHDVDVSLTRALHMAEIEHEFGISATYLVMPDTPLYSLKERSGFDIVKKIHGLGHEVGLHLILHSSALDSLSIYDSLEHQIAEACMELEDILGLQIHSFSLHRPMLQALRGPLMLAGRVNAYAKELMDWYLSDAKGYWREGEPHPKLFEQRKVILQLLIHPIWWGNEHMAPSDRLQEFFEAETRSLGPVLVEQFDGYLLNTIPGVRRRGLI